MLKTERKRLSVKGVQNVENFFLKNILSYQKKVVPLHTFYETYQRPCVYLAIHIIETG